MYKLTLNRSAKKDFRALPKNLRLALLDKSLALESDPFPYNSLKLSGYRDLYRIRFGDYRVVYSVNHERKEIDILYVRHRRDVYRNL